MHLIPLDNPEAIAADAAPWLRDIADFLREWHSDSPFVELRTSGSTGEPKLIRLPKQLMRESARATLAFFGLQRGESALLCMSARYVAGKMMLVRAIEGGLRLWAVEPGRAVGFPAEAGRIAFAAMVPMQVEASMALPDFARIDRLIIGGGAISPELEEQLRALPAPLCYATYGMTETASHVALRRINRASEPMLEGRATRGNEALAQSPATSTEYSEPPSVYSALPGITFSVDRRDCLVIHAPRLLSAPLTTNDVVRLIGDEAQPTRFQWLGRADFVVNSGGIKLHPEQLEKRLAGAVAVPFYLTKRPSREFGEELVMVVERDALMPEEAAALHQAFEQRLARYERPKAILCRVKFEYSESGKLLRR